MNTTINPQSIARTRLLFVGTIAIMLFAFFGINRAHAMITSTLDLGSQGPQVTELQTYLATNASIYPSGLITGFFGSLTQAAVQRFQAAQGIVSSGSPETTGYGRVGPQTMNRINALNSAGGIVSWDTSPIISVPNVQYTNNSATFSWVTNEPTQGQLYYDSIPLTLVEESAPRQSAYVSGRQVIDQNGFQTSHTITINNLQPNTFYYYLTRAVDVGGNTSLVWPSSFRTNN